MDLILQSILHNFSIVIFNIQIYFMLPAKQGLYDPQNEHDNCGAGFICSLQGKKTNDIIHKALDILDCLEHRGAVSADGKTGDGCGLLLQMPDSFMRAEAQAHFAKDLGQHYAVGMIFMGAEPAAQQASKAALESALAGNELAVMGWREVPLNPEVCGEIALDQLPHIEQVFIDAEKLDHAQVPHAYLWRGVRPKLPWSTTQTFTFAAFLIRWSPTRDW